MSESTMSSAVPWDQAEGLRSPLNSAARDPRHDPTSSLELQHAEVAGLELSPQVPERIRIAFDTARNLYLYAWHVYRFYPAAEMQALSALEAGLRLALPARLPPQYQKPHRPVPMLRGLLRYAVTEGLVRNEGFRRWHQRAEEQARQRQRMEQLIRMEQEGLTELVVDPSEPVEVTGQDREWDLAALLPESLPSRRNAHAHGDGPLSRQVRGTLELVGEILNQVFASVDRDVPAASDELGEHGPGAQPVAHTSAPPN